MNEAIDKLITDWQAPIYRLALRRLGNEADAADITQEVFVQVLRHRPGLEDPSRLRPWIYRVAHNAIGQRLRALERQRRKTREKAAELPIAHEAPDAAEAEERARVRAGLDRLEDELRAALILRYYQGLSQREIGEVLGLPRTTIQARLERGLRRLKAQLVGAPMAVPAIERALGPELTPIPPSLHAQIKAAASLASPQPIAGALTTGALMNIKLASAGLVLALTGLFLGAGLTRVLAPAASEERITRLEAENARLESERLRLQSARRQQEAKIARLEARARDAKRRAVDTPDRETAAAPPPASSPPVTPPTAPGRAAGPASRAGRADVEPAMVERIRGLAELIGAVQDRFEGLEEDQLDAEQRALLARERRRVSEAAGPLLKDLPVLAEKVLALVDEAGPQERARLLNLLAAFREVLPADQRALANNAALAIISGADPTAVKLAAAALLRPDLGSDDEARAASTLRRFLEAEPDADARRPLIRLLGQLGAAEAQSALLALALDTREAVALRVRALAQVRAEGLTDLSAYPRLLGEPAPELRRAAVEGLAAALARAPSRPLRAALEDALEAADDALRPAILAALEVHGDRQSLSRLQGMANDPLRTDGVRREARVAAERLSAVLDKAERGG